MPRSRIGRAGLLAFAVASAGLAAAEGLDMPEQIGPGSSRPADRVQVDGIGAPREDPARIEQSPRSVDLCGPDVPEAERRRLGIDCTALDRREAGGAKEGPRGLSEDPLLSPRDPDAAREFRDLGLGEDVPATVILQP